MFTNKVKANIFLVDEQHGFGSKRFYVDRYTTGGREINKV